MVDDHELFRVGIRSTIAGMSNRKLHILFEAETGFEFFRLLEANPIPDLVLLDIMLPDTSGVAIARELKQRCPDTKIIMLSSEVSEDLISELCDIGVDGYMGKLSRPEDLQKAILAVLQGIPYYGHSVSKLMFDIYMRQRQVAEMPSGKWKLFSKTKQEEPEKVHLTETEKTVVVMLGDGLTSKEIAESLGVSSRTVDTHRRAVLEKLGFKRTVDLIKYAIKEGFVKL